MKDHVPESKYVEGKPKFGWAPVYNQVEQMVSDEEPVSSLEEILGYQKTIKEIYEESGESSAATPNW
jgi:hypothetical protein